MQCHHSWNDPGGEVSRRPVNFNHLHRANAINIAGMLSLLQHISNKRITVCITSELKKYEPIWIHEACIMQHMMPFTAVEIRFLSCTKLCFAPQTQAMRLDHQGCLLIPLRRGMEEDQFSHCTLDKSEVLSATSHHYTLLTSKNHLRTKFYRQIL